MMLDLDVVVDDVRDLLMGDAAVASAVAAGDVAG